MADVFISYHEQSAGNLVPRIAAALENGGISCWYAKRNMPLNVPFAEEIVQAIEDCKVFLLILNQQSVKSLHVASETAIFFRRLEENKDLSLIPFRVDDCALSNRMFYYLSLTPIFDACPPTEERIQALTAQIAGTLNRKRPRNAKAAPQTVREIGMQ